MFINIQAFEKKKYLTFEGKHYKSHQDMYWFHYCAIPMGSSNS